MRNHNDNDFLNSRKWKRLKYSESKRRRFFLAIEIEPDTKKSMPEQLKDEVQRQLLQALVEQGRRAFRGPLALQLRITTSKRNPSHLHNIAKNLLDLFATPRPGIGSHRSALLYRDDSQIEALSVTCQHDGEGGRPAIDVIASPMRDVLENIQLVCETYEPTRLKEDDQYLRAMETDRELEHFFDVINDQSEIRKRFGDAGIDAMIRMARLSAQEALFSEAALKPSDIFNAYRAAELEEKWGFEGMWERTFNLSPLRIKLEELPNEAGASAIYRGKVDEGIRKFKNLYGKLIDPLLIPVAVEVLVKPCHPDHRRGLHDLDNVFRDYLMPSLTEILKPISHFSFAFEHSISLDESANRNLRRPPASTRCGVTRYEVWKLPPAKYSEKGFVSVAVVADTTGFNGLFEKLSQELSDWEDDE